MGIFGNIFGNAKLGIQISNQVIRVLLKDKGLFVYPVVMALLSFVLLILFFVPFILLGGLAFGFVSLFAMLIIYYFVTTFMATYFIFALYIAFTSFVQGKKIGMVDALGQASKYFPLIFSWTIFYTIVITVVRMIESRVQGFAGAILQAVIGIGLFLGTTFALPVIFEEKVGPIDAVKKSAMFIINNIGKTFSGIIYFDIIGFVIKFIGGLFIISAILMGVIDVTGFTYSLGGFTIIGHSALFEIIAVFVIGVAIYIMGVLFNYVTLHIYYLVVYDYVRSGKVPKGMDETLIRSSISHSTGATGPIGGRGSGGNTGGKQAGKGGKNAPGNQGPFGGLFQSGGGDSPDLKDFVK